jgi:hypothetical protein
MSINEDAAVYLQAWSWHGSMLIWQHHGQSFMWKCRLSGGSCRIPRATSGWFLPAKTPGADANRSIRRKRQSLSWSPGITKTCSAYPFEPKGGDTLWHAVTPLEPGGERIILTVEYVTDRKMGAFKRFISNMKGAIAYFGISALWRRPNTRRPQSTADNASFP